MNVTRSVLAILAPVSLVALTACGSAHATLSDCVDYYLDQGKDPRVLMEVCTNILEQQGQEEFDKLFLD